MAPKIPKSFGVVKNRPDQTKGDGTHLEKDTPKSSIPLSTSSLKRKDVVDLTDEASNKPKTDGSPFEPHSLALTHFGSLGSLYVKDEEVKEW